MKIKKTKVGTFNLKKYVFLFTKGHMSNGLTIGQIEDKLVEIIGGVFKLFYTVKGFEDPKEKYPYAYDKNGEQIGGKVEDYDC